MSEYDSPKRPLPYALRNAVVFSQTTENDDACVPASSFVWPTDSDERVPILFSLSLNEYNTLASAIDVGSDIAYGADALRVMWLWLRNTRCEVSICDQIEHCVENDFGVQDAILDIVNGTDSVKEVMRYWLINDPAFIAAMCEKMGVCLPTNVTFVQEMTENIIGSPQFEQAASIVASGNSGNTYPALPTDNDEVCNAASYIADQLETLIDEVFDDLVTADPDEVLSLLLGFPGWHAEALYTFITAVVPELANKAAIMAAYTAAKDDLKCQLANGSLSQGDAISWVADTFAGNPVFANILATAIASASENGRWTHWALIGSLQTGADCTGCSEPPNIRLEVYPGRNPDTLEFIENEGENSWWKVRRQASGHYVTGAWRSVGLIPFYIIGYRNEVGTVWNLAGNQIASGTYEMDNLPCDEATTFFITIGGPSVPEGDTIELLVSLDPCTEVWGIEYYGEIVEQDASSVTGRGLLTPDSGGLYQLELKVLNDACLTVDSGIATSSSFEDTFYTPCFDDALPFSMVGNNLPAIPGEIKLLTFSSVGPFEVTVNYST